MLSKTSTLVSGNAATSPSTTRDDETIPLLTGLALLDSDLDLVARHFRHQGWFERVDYLNDTVAHSILCYGQLVDYTRSPESAADFAHWAVVELRRRIGELLDLWGAAKPVDADAAALYLTSLKPAHRRAARTWMKTNEETPWFLQDRWVALAALAHLSAIAGIDAAEEWRTGPRECSDDWFELPIKGGRA